MVKKSKRKRILKFFDNKKLPVEFEAEEMYKWLNLNKNTNVTRNEMPQLLRCMQGFSPVTRKMNQISTWVYVGNQNAMD